MLAITRALVVATAVMAVLSAQRGGPPVPARDASGAPSEAGSSRISGRVTAGDTSRPLHRAIVTLDTGNLQTRRWTSTDAEGQWAFERVTLGEYTIIASRDGYVTWSYGQKGAYGSPTKLKVAASQVVENIDFALPRGGVITGTIVDETGEPIGGALVQPMRLQFVDGVQQLVAVQSGIQSLGFGGLTDDQGNFRIFGLAPGTYYLSVAVTAGGVGRSDDRTAYAVTYYPGTSSIADARSVSVASGTTASANFAAVPIALATVAGRVVGSTSQPYPGPTYANVGLAVVAPGHAVQSTSRLSTRTDARGMFVITGVPPGDYYLEARGVSPDTRAQEFAGTRLTVAGRDLASLALMTAPMASATGTFVLDDTSAQLPNDFYVQALPTDLFRMGSGGGMAGAPQGRPNGAGIFTLAGLAGREVIRVSSLFPGWWLKSVTIDGRDVTDSGYDFASGETVSGIHVAVTRRMASITGTVREKDGKPASDCSVVAFARDDARWGPRTRYVSAATAKDDGTFEIDGLPAGDYMVVAVAPLDQGEELDASRLSSWRALGSPIALGDGETRSTNLTIAHP
jgi:hypothetical protein